MSGVSLWTGRLLWTCSDFKFSVGDSLELSGIQFTPPKWTRHRQDSFVMSGVAVWISFKSRGTANCSATPTASARIIVAMERRRYCVSGRGEELRGSRRLCDDLITRRMQARRGWFTASIAAARLIPCTLLTVAGRHQSIRTRYGRRCGRVIRSLKRDITVNGGNSRECLWEVALLTRNERFRNPCVPYSVSKFCC